MNVHVSVPICVFSLFWFILFCSFYFILILYMLVSFLRRERKGVDMYSRQSEEGLVGVTSFRGLVHHHGATWQCAGRDGGGEGAERGK